MNGLTDHSGNGRPDPTNKQLERYLQIAGRGAGHRLTIANRLGQFANALETTVGREILQDVADSLSRALDIMTKGKTAEERNDAAAEYRALERIAERWGEKMEKYNNILNDIQEKTT